MLENTVGADAPNVGLGKLPVGSSAVEVELPTTETPITQHFVRILNGPSDPTHPRVIERVLHYFIPDCLERDPFFWREFFGGPFSQRVPSAHRTTVFIYGACTAFGRTRRVRIAADGRRGDGFGAELTSATRQQRPWPLLCYETSHQAEPQWTRLMKGAIRTRR
jgi:hypothetical protein